MVADRPPSLSSETKHRSQPASALRRFGALLYGITCHSLFAISVYLMFTVIGSGFSLGRGNVSGWVGVAVNIALLVQFPILHSWLLTKRGRKLLAFISHPFGKPMVTTTYVIISAVQLIAVCVLWTPSGVVWHPFSKSSERLFELGYLLSWLYLAKAMVDAGLSVQSGSLGWLSVFRGKKPLYPPMPERGTFRHSRQPIYLAFALILLTAPVWTPDKLVVCALWISYLFRAPRRKEERLKEAYGERFLVYQEKTPYFFPKIVLPKLTEPLSRAATAALSFLLHLIGL